MHEIIPIARIEREAAQAAQQYDCVNAACPYPFGTSAGQLFKHLCLQARESATKAPLAHTHGRKQLPNT